MSNSMHSNNYQLLRVYSYYRCLLGGLLLAMFYSALAKQILGHSEPSLYLISASAYTGLSLLTLILLWWFPQSPSIEQIFTVLFIDIVALTVMMHASGGPSSGLGFLLLVCVAAGGIFLGAQTSTALASLATIFVIAEAIYSIGQGEANSRDMFSAGTLGFMLFITSLTLNYLGNRIRISTVEAETQAAQAAHLQKLAQLIIERMHTGVIVTSASGQIELLNQSAAKLLNTGTNDKPPQQLAEIPELEEHLQMWRQEPQRKPATLQLTPNHHSDEQNHGHELSQSNELRLSFAELDPEQHSETLIFLEDHRALTREAQQLKLSSLGRLTASIAHEIRNPLSSINHAGQLLAESPDITAADRRLTEIIDTNAKRVNQIIENVMQLSRRRATQPELVELTHWLPHFVQDYRDHSNADISIDFTVNSESISTRVDSSHLAQVMNNIMDNGLRYSELSSGEKTLALRCGTTSEVLPYIDVIDRGEGISADSLQHIFEPFFTTEASGSGLGLYLSKQLCEANHANLSYSNPAGGPSRFRITFAHPDRIF